MWLIDILFKGKWIVFLIEDWEATEAPKWDEKISNTKKILDRKDMIEGRKGMSKVDTIRGAETKRTWKQGQLELSKFRLV